MFLVKIKNPLGQLRRHRPESPEVVLKRYDETSEHRVAAGFHNESVKGQAGVCQGCVIRFPVRLPPAQLFLNCGQMSRVHATGGQTGGESFENAPHLVHFHDHAQLDVGDKTSHPRPDLNQPFFFQVLNRFPQRSATQIQAF